MVFPQGLYSAEAITALKACGYLAAVNSEATPATQPESLNLRDLLGVALTKFEDFPLFGRRYPYDLSAFAFDLFIGKPALAVEHHLYFRNGYGSLEAFVDRLNGLDQRLEWCDLGTICSRSCLTRVGADGDVQVRFYTNRFSLTNQGTTIRRYSLVRQQKADEAVSITVDGCERHASRENGQLRLKISLDPGQTVYIRGASIEADLGGRTLRDPLFHTARVRIRRHFSEFRDNYLDTSRVVNAFVAAARN
jgi:hypothetical protein